MHTNNVLKTFRICYLKLESHVWLSITLSISLNTCLLPSPVLSLQARWYLSGCRAVYVRCLIHDAGGRNVGQQGQGLQSHLLCKIQCQAKIAWSAICSTVFSSHLSSQPITAEIPIPLAITFINFYSIQSKTQYCIED